MDFGGTSISFVSFFPLTDKHWANRMDVASSDLTFIRMRAALDNMHYDPAHLAEQSNSEQEMMLLGTHLRELLLQSFVPPPDAQDSTTRVVEPEAAPARSSILSDDQRLHSWALRYQRPDPIVMDGDPVVNLNASQIGAIASMLGNRLSLVQGVSGRVGSTISNEA